MVSFSRDEIFIMDAGKLEDTCGKDCWLILESLGFQGRFISDIGLNIKHRFWTRKPERGRFPLGNIHCDFSMSIIYLQKK